MKRLLVLLLLPALWTGGARGAQLECVFQHYSSSEGLPHNYISDICVDRQGMVWICTWYGLSRFDGYSFKNYRTLPGDNSPLSHNRFLDVSEDAYGDLWLTTYDNRLYRFNRTTEQFEDIAALLTDFRGDKNNIKSEAYLNTPDQGTWIVFSGHGLVRAETLPGGGIQLARVGDEALAGERGIALHQDSLQRLWVISDAGASVVVSRSGKYDVTALYRDQPVVDLAEYGQWVVLAVGDKLALHSTQTFETLMVPLPVRDHITSVTIDPADGRIYAGTARSGIFSYDSPSGRLLPEYPVRERIRHLTADSKGIIWVTTEGAGISRYIPALKSYKHYEQQMNAASYYVDTIARVVDRGDLVWLKLNRHGFGYYDRTSDSFFSFYNDPQKPDCRMSNGVACFEIDSENVLWMSTSDRSLERITIIQPRARIFTPDARLTNKADAELRALALDQENNVWMATKGGGLFCYDPLWRLIEKYPDRGMPYIGLAYTIWCAPNGDIWVGTKGDGVYRLRQTPRGREFDHYRNIPGDNFSLSNDNVYSITGDSQGSVWIATYGGGINKMVEQQGKARFLNAYNTFFEYPLNHGDKVRYMLCDKQGTMLAATVEGLILFDPTAEEPRKTKFKLAQKVQGDSHSLGNNDVIHILRDSKERIWLSTFGGGVNLYKGLDEQETPRFDIYSTEQGLSSNIVMAATEDHDGFLWFSTENGLSKFNPETGEFSNFSRYDGIPTTNFSEATALTDSKGDVLFGSVNNLYIIDPEQMTYAHEDFKLAFTGFDLRNAEVAVGAPDGILQKTVMQTTSITLPHDFSNFRIYYASLNSRLQPRIIYRYMLEGYDSEWNIVKELRSALYSNLPPGKYTFKVSCSADNNPALSETISMGFVVSPPWWRTGWMYLVYVLFGGLVFYLVLRTLYAMFVLRNKVRVEQQMTELKLQFFTNISHELRTPLTLILGGIEEVKRQETLSGQGSINLSMAEKNTRRMLALINQLLDFRKVVNDKLELKVSYLDMVALATDVLDDFREMAAERKIELLLSTSVKQLMVWVDKGRIESVIYNLIVNAFKFTPDGGRITLTVSHREGTPEFSLSVADTGAGIAKEKLSRVFERFVQVGEPVSDTMKGSGIGLALCRDITVLHGGTIDVESTPGEGSVFTVTLPMGNAHFDKNQIDFQGTEPVQTSAGEVSQAELSTYESMRREDVAPPADAPHIMVVEDNREVRIFIYNQLGDKYHISEAENGADAFERVSQEAPDLVITDLMMPVMDGIEFINKVRNDFNVSHIPIIMLTAKTAPSARIEAMRYGADSYITKPFSIELLQANIENLLHQRRRLAERLASADNPAVKVIDLSGGEVVVTDRDQEFIKKTMEWIEQNIANTELTIDQLASHVNMGRTTMYNKLKSLTGKSPVELIKEYRIGRAKSLLKTGKVSVSEVAYTVGFADPGYFSKCFKDVTGTSPAEFIKQQGNE